MTAVYQWCRLGKRYELPSRTLAAWCVDWHGKQPNWDSTQYTNLFVFLSFFLFFFFSFFCVCVGVSTGRSGLGLCPTCDQPDQVEFQIFKPTANQTENRIGWDGSCRKVVGSRSGLIIWKTARIRPRKYEKRQNPARKFWKTIEIQPDFAKSNEILAIFGKILAGSSEISPDLA